MIVALLSHLFCVQTAQADKFRKQVIRSAEDYLKIQALRISHDLDATHYTIKVPPLPQRMKESPCPVALKVFALKEPKPGKQQLKVVCSSASPWSLYIKGQISIFRPVLVSQESIAIGATPTETQITWKDRDIGQLKEGYFTDPASLIEQKAVRKIKPDAVLTPKMFSHKQP